jgi:hypothetical protein
MLEMLYGKRIKKFTFYQEACKAILRHSPHWIFGFALAGKKSPGSIKLQFKKSQMIYEIKYLYWAIYDPIVKNALNQRNFKP